MKKLFSSTLQKKCVKNEIVEGLINVGILKMIKNFKAWEVK